MSIVYKYFSEYLENIEKKFIRAAISGNKDEARSLISANPNVVNYQDNETGLTGLMIFAADGVYSLVDEICSMPDADVSLGDAYERTALDMAIMIGREDIEERISERLIDDVSKFDEPPIEDDQQLEGSTTNVIKLRTRNKPTGPGL